jgi:hypothetical protein
MKMASAGNATRTESKTQRNRDLWFLLWPSVTLYLLGMVSIIWLDTPQSWWAAGIAFAGGTVLQVTFFRRQGGTKQLILFTIGLACFGLSIVGAVADAQWLFFLGFLGFLVTFAIRLMLLVDSETPAGRRWSMYLKAISLPVMAIGSLSQTEWLLWTGLVGIVLSILVDRTRHRHGHSKAT